jgi:hypothetical protein
MLLSIQAAPRLQRKSGRAASQRSESESSTPLALREAILADNMRV